MKILIVRVKQCIKKCTKKYKAQDFDTAIYVCERLKRHFDGKMEAYYDMWIERCEYMKTQKLPKDWNGVFIATSK